MRTMEGSGVEVGQWQIRAGRRVCAPPIIFLLGIFCSHIHVAADLEAALKMLFRPKS